jgi:hypothetical protein
MPYLQLPSGAYFKMPEGASPAEAFALAQQKHPNEFLTPGEKEERQGLGAAAGTAFREAKASTESGLGELFNSKILKDWGAQDKLAAKQNQFIPTTSEDVEQAMSQGLVPGVGAAFRKYVSEPVGGIVGRYGVPMAVGAGAAALAPVAGVGAAGATLINSAATALADLPAEVAENLDRAEETGATKDVGKALGYGLIQAGLTGFGIPGTGMAVKAVNKILGKEAVTLGEQVAKGVITKEEAIAKLHGPLRNTLEGMGVNAVTGTAMMVGTEAARRAAADQGVFTPEAFEAYKENAIGALELSPIFGALHGLPKRGGEKRAIEVSANKRQAELDKQQREEQDKIAAEQEVAAQQAELQKQQAEFQKRQVETGTTVKEGSMEQTQFNLLGETIPQTDVKGKKLVEGAVSPLENKINYFKTGVNEKGEPTYGATQSIIGTETVAERENQQDTQQKQNKELFADHFDAERKVERLEKELITAAQKGDLDTITKIQPLLKNYRNQVETLGAELKKLSPIEESPDVLMSTYRGQLKKKMAELAKYAESNPEKVDKLVPEIKELQAKIDEVSKQGIQFDMFEPDAMAAEKKADVRAAKEQLAERQQDLFAQVENARPKSEEVIDNYQQGLLDLEEAHASGASDRIINSLLNKLREAALEKEASRTGVVSGETIENQVQRVERIKRSLEEAKENYNNAMTDAERQQHVATIGELQKRLATAQIETSEGRPIIAEKEAFTRQEAAKRDAIETVRSILSGEYFNSRNVDVASTMKSGLENKISDAGKEYTKAAVDEINAVRRQSKQESLSVDDALKLTTTLQKQFDLLAKDPTILARRTKRLEKAIALTEKTYEELKDSPKKFDAERRENLLKRLEKQKEELAEQNKKSDSAVKDFEESLEAIKKDYFEGASRVQRAPFELAPAGNLPKALRIKVLEERISDLAPGAGPRVTKKLKEVEKQIDALDKERPTREEVKEIDELKKEQLALRTILGRYLTFAGESSRTEKLKELKKELAEVKAEPEVVESKQAPLKGQELDKTGTYKNTGPNGKKVNTPVYERKEQDNLTVREKEAGVREKEPEGVNPDQRNLFDEKELEPIATVRTSHENFVKLLQSATVRKLKEKLASGKISAKEEPSKQGHVSPNAGKVKRLEALRLQIENISQAKRPPRFEPTEKQKAELTEKKLNKIKANYDRRLFLHDLRLNRLKVEEKKLADELKGSREFGTILDEIKEQRMFIEDNFLESFDQEKSSKMLLQQAQDLMTQRTDLVTYIERVKKTIEKEKKDISEVFNINTSDENFLATARSVYKQRKDFVDYINENKRLLRIAEKLPDTDKKKKKRVDVLTKDIKKAEDSLEKVDASMDKLPTFIKQLETAEETLQKIDEGGPEARAKVLDIVDRLVERAKKIIRADVEIEVNLLNELEDKISSTKEVSPEIKASAEKVAEERKLTGAVQAKANEQLETMVRQKRELEQKFAEVNKTLPSTKVTTDVLTRKIVEKVEDFDVETSVSVGLRTRPEDIRQLKKDIKSLKEELKEALKEGDNTTSEYAKQEKQLSFLETSLKKSEEYADVKKQIREAEARMAKLDKSSEAYKSEARSLDTLKNRRDILAEPLRVKKITRKVAPETPAERLEKVKAATIEGAREMAEIKKGQKQARDLEKAENDVAKIEKTIQAKKAEIENDKKEVSILENAILSAKSLDSRVEKTNKLRNLKAEIAKKDLTKEIEALEKTVPTLKETLAEAANKQEGVVNTKNLKKAESNVKKDLDSRKKEIEADQKKLTELEKAFTDATTSEAKATAKADYLALKKEIARKNLGAVVEILQHNLKLVKDVGTGVERSMVILGNAPERTERSKPIKTGVAQLEKAQKKAENDVAEAIASEKHGYGPNNTYFEGPSRNRYRLTASRQNGLPPSKAREFIENLKKKLPKDVKVNYVDTIADLPEKEKKGLEIDGITEGSENGNGVRGYVNRDGEVYIIGGNHVDMKDLETTYAHELLGHVGVDRLLGEKGFEALNKRINDQHGGVLKLADELGIRNLIDGTIADYALTIKKRGEAGASKAEIDSLMKDMEIRAVRELIAHTAEQRATEGFIQKANRWMKELVGAVRAFLRDNGFAELSKVSTSDIFNIIRQSERSFQRNELGGFRTNDGSVVFSRDPKYLEGFNSGLRDTAGTVYQKEKTVLDRLKGNALGMTMAHRFVDRFAGLEYIARNMRNKLEGLQMMYYNRLYDQRNNMMSEIATHGPVGIVKDEKNGTYSYASKKGPSLAKVAEVAGKAKDEIGNGTAALEQFGLYLAVERAASNKGGLEAGLESLNLAGKVTTKMADEVLKFGRGNTHFQEARKLYREYNNGQLDFMVESGRLSKAEAAEMKKGDYVAYYRVDKNDEVWDNERNVKVGDLKTQSYLRELLGGDSAIVNFETGALQNTYMLTDMAMGNIAAKNTAYTLQTLGIADIKKGDGPASKDVIRFYEDGEKKHAVINTSGEYKNMESTLEKMRAAGKANTPEYKKLRERAEASRESASMFGNIPSELIVKGMEGISMTLPAAVSFLRGPANLLRKGTTRNPAYAMRVAFKDSLSGWITSGADNKPIISTLSALNKMAKGEAPEIRKLQEQGIIGGHVFSGTMADMRTIALQMAEGKSGWEKLWAKADRLAIMADESARLSLYNGFVKKGMSPMEASLATLEAQNFTKHGYSPTVRMLSTMIPFFNSQIQGLNVFARAISGKSLFEDKLGVRETMLKRGATVAGLTLAYTALMQNNEAYKNADEYDKLNNWFIPLPFFKDPIKVPIPFESGVVFKALPEAMYNLAATDAKSKDVLPAVAKLVVSQVPGVSNLFLPQGAKPIMESLTNTNFYTMSPIESQRQLQELPGHRSNATTTELSKLVGRTLGVSPIQIDHLVNGYTGSIGTAMMSMFNPILREGSAPDATSKDWPIVGGFFQPTDAPGLINKAYVDMQNIEQVSATYKRLNEQDPDKADAFYRKYVNQIDNATAAGTFKQRMGELNTEERSIRADKDLTSAEKRKLLDANRQDKIQLAKDFRATLNE